MRRFALIFVTLCACSKTDANATNFSAAMVTYLEKRGDLCLGKPSWPIDVTAHQAALGDRNAVQMPVLEKLGLVTVSDVVTKVASEEGPVSVAVKRYQLTEMGKRSYLTKKGSHASELGAPGDFCAATLTLDKVVKWETLNTGDGGTQAVVTYTYQVHAAPWTRDPEIRKVFPVVDRIVRGAGSAELKEGFSLTPAGWVANELVEDSSMATKEPAR